MSTKHLILRADPDDLEVLEAECSICDQVETFDLCEPNSFEDIAKWMAGFEKKHAGCAPPKKAKKKKVTLEPDPMASAQAAVLRERLETFNKS